MSNAFRKIFSALLTSGLSATRRAAMLLAILFCALPTWAEQSWTTGSCTATLSDDGTMVISGSGAMDDYSNTPPWWDVRSSINTVVIGSGVTRIGQQAFNDCGNLSTVTFEANSQLQSIGSNAFSCTGLTSIEIPASVKTIGTNVFNGCGNLTTVTFEDNSTLNEIGDGAFLDTGLTSIEIPVSVVTIGFNVFDGCGNLSTVTFEANSQLQSIGDYAFFCSALTSIEIPVSVVTIGYYAFYGCRNLNSFTINRSDAINLNLFEDVWANCTSLSSITLKYTGEVPEDYAVLWSIGDGYTIDNPTATTTTMTVGSASATLSTVSPTYTVSFNANGGTGTVPASMTFIYNVSQTLPNTTFTKGVFTSVAWNTAADGTGSSYDLGASVKNLASEAGATVKLYAQWPPHSWTTGSCTATLSDDGTMVISGSGAMDDYLNKLPWGDVQGSIKKLVIGSGVTHIGQQAFHDCGNLSTVTFEDNSQLQSIGDYAFWGSALTSIEIPASVKTIGGYAFNACGNLTTVTFEANSQLQDIVDYAFSGSALSSIEIPASVESIGAEAFYGCGNLTTVTFEDNSTLNYIGVDAFLDTRLTSIEIPASVETIGFNAFSGCCDLNSFTINRSGAKDLAIGENVWADCTSLSSITLKYTGEVPEDYAVLWSIGDGYTIDNPTATTTTMTVGSALATLSTVSPTYTVSFNANGGTGTMESQQFIIDVAQNLTANAFTAPSGKVFGGWNTAANGSGTSYSNGQSVQNLTSEIGATITLYAQWVEEKYTEPLTFQAVNDGDITITNQLGLTMKYSKNGGEKTTIGGNTDEITIPVQANDVIRLYGKGTDNKTYNTNGLFLGTFIKCSGDCYIYGNIMSLVDEIGYATNVTLTAGSTFHLLFYQIEGSTTLKNHPEKALLLPATTLTENCYASMFRGCKGLTTAPELPATTLAKSCYSSMFYGCKGLTTAPELPATTLEEYCYSSMFYGCTKLNYVKCLATDLTANNCTSYWLNGVAQTGTFVKVKDVSWTTESESGIPSGWTVEEIQSASVATEIHEESVRGWNGESDVWYDLQGRKLNGKPTKKGIYIVNGRKVLF